MDDELPGPPALPGPRECLVCFVERMVVAYGCGNRLHWAALWRDRRAPRATALERRLQRSGGYCDCEVLANAYARREEWDGDEPPRLPGGQPRWLDPAVRALAGADRVVSPATSVAGARVAATATIGSRTTGGR